MAEEKSVTPSPASESTVAVRRGKVECVDLYEIKDNELDALEKGTSADLQMNFAIFLLSIAFSAICSLATATFANVKIEYLFNVVAVVGVVLGIYFLLAWWKSKSSIKDICTRIRGRIQPEIVIPSSAVTVSEVEIRTKETTFDPTKPSG